MPITALYAGLLGLLLVVLSIRVIGVRRRDSVSLGHEGNATLTRRVRAQGNLAEYAPMALILLGVLELSGTPAWLLHAIGATLLAGRLSHGWALSFTAGNGAARVAGMILTFTAIIAGAVLCLRVFVAG